MTANPPAEMVRVPGGVVSLGPYLDDPAGLGEREVFLRPYFIDRTARAEASLETFAARGGRFPNAAELEHALRLHLVQPAMGVEQTSSFVSPVDAEAVAAIEGVGSYALLLAGTSRMVLAPLGSFVAHGRSAMALGAEVGRAVAKVVRVGAAIRRGRGESWPSATSFTALGERTDAAPPVMQIEAGERCFVLHEEGGWAFVARFGRGEGVGWLPSELLAPG